jgi:hypothetical protein
VELVVTDEGTLSSPPDQVVISSSNVPPTASAGSDQLVVYGNLVVLNGTGSSDPDFDPLAYAWILSAKPVGSAAALSGEATAAPTFVPDLEGTYTVGLMVSDGFAFSGVDEVIVTAITGAQFAENVLADAVSDIVSLPPTSVTSEGNQNSLENLLTKAVQNIQDDKIDKARRRLEDALVRTDGCVLRGAPDTQGSERDWITDCAAQTELYNDLIAVLNALGN